MQIPVSVLKAVFWWALRCEMAEQRHAVHVDQVWGAPFVRDVCLLRGQIWAV